MAWGMGGSKEYKSSSKKSVSINSAVRPMMTFGLVGPARMDRADSTAWVRARFSEGSGCPRASTTTVCLRCSASASCPPPYYFKIIGGWTTTDVCLWLLPRDHVSPRAFLVPLLLKY